MIYSPAKAEDMKLRVALLEDMELLLRLGQTEAATEAGKASKHLAERIKSHDYAREDRYLAWERKAMQGITEKMPQIGATIEV